MMKNVPSDVAGIPSCGYAAESLSLCMLTGFRSVEAAGPVDDIKKTKEAEQLNVFRFRLC